MSPIQSFILLMMIPDVPAFEEKKLCTMVVGAWNPERIAMLDFFAAKPLGVFDLYGQAPPQYREHPMNKGRIPGYYSGSEKLSVLKNYRFCVCFENTHTTPGYITEKIFDTFAGGCVPIYWGPENVEKYIPKECFIDYRDFNTNEELYQYITTMTKERYEEYLDNIARYLTSEAASLFSVEYFEQLLYEAANR
jgi:alpha(1,3/1,4) fucosyltransferase